ncbi:TIR domain-containing protein [Pseudorhizobium marinum]|uniref:TIR domain-containing protein n=1 Tax=Pseudorhizobium marinum TaxID=1496690 RepID=UPI0004978450|nr:TIR domain-containing protein [Pseudorhizobium marinum]
MSKLKTIQPEVFDRFLGDHGKIRAIEALKDQRIVRGSVGAAEELFARGEMKTFMPGDFLITENGWSNSLYLLLAGAVKVVVKGNEITTRVAGQHVGDMAMIDPGKARSADVVATSPTVALIVQEPDFTAVAQNHSDLWRQIAKELGERLRERSKKIRQANTVPHVFIACASESVPVADAFAARLEAEGVNVRKWTEGVFKLNDHSMESLEVQLDLMDFALAIFSPDDKVRSRKKEQSAPRDNTVFELGLFAGKIGRDRSFFVVPKGVRVKVPSDLAGITSARYTGDTITGFDVEEASQQIIERVNDKGCR